MIVLLGGVPAAGKSTAARRIINCLQLSPFQTFPIYASRRNSACVIGPYQPELGRKCGPDVWADAAAKRARALLKLCGNTALVLVEGLRPYRANWASSYPVVRAWIAPPADELVERWSARSYKPWAVQWAREQDKLRNQYPPDLTFENGDSFVDWFIREVKE